jgi:curli biogenesis system outer membrane secretion channel CsgG
MKKVIWMCLLLTCIAFTVFGVNERAGIIEFEIKNDIDLQNANTILPEMLITHLRKINRFELYERILLHKILEEQELQLSGIIEENTVTKIGQLYGLDCVLAIG